mmetsp:Transcript_44422/g.53726  ORF Transcript_44422/g.53726 Transcript_44422/m.53726 type:complete len:247 (-) Transcript_44422:100-840(-)
MPLDDCLVMISLATAEALTPEAPSRKDDIIDCITTWSFMSKTNFYNNEDLVLPWWFGALCFSFSICGVAMLWSPPKWTIESRFPFTIFCLMLVVIQGPFSFAADYIHMTNDSLFHVYDRFIAIFLMSFETIRIVTMCNQVNTSTMILSLLAFSFALFSFVNSQLSQSKKCTSGFVFWHALWHIYPFFAASIALFDKHIVGEFDPTTAVKKMGDSRRKEGVLLLSTRVMKNTTLPAAVSSPNKKRII